MTQSLVQRYNPNHPDKGVLEHLAQSLHVKVSTAADLLSQFEYDVRIALKKEPFVVICQGRIITSANYLNAEHCKRCDLREGCPEYAEFDRNKRGDGTYKGGEKE